MVPQKRIRPLAVCVFRDGNRILVSDGIDPSDQTAYCRPLGGSIEFGELSAEAVVREIREELGAEVRDVRLLGVLENLFTLDGRAGHEIVFVYDARFADESLYRQDGIPFCETDRTSGFARWFDLSRAGDDPAQLAPEGLFDFLRKDADKTRSIVTGMIRKLEEGL